MISLDEYLELQKNLPTHDLLGMGRLLEHIREVSEAHHKLVRSARTTTAHMQTEIARLVKAGEYDRAKVLERFLGDLPESASIPIWD